MGTVYLIHFDEAIGSAVNTRGRAQHYLGYSSRPIKKRLREHELGSASAARIMQVVQALGIHWRLARTWEGTRGTERSLKKRHNSPQLCPICAAHRAASRAHRTEEKEMQGEHLRNPNGAVEDLVNTLEELKPGMVSSRMVLEISTEDKGLAMLLKKLAEDIPDEVNASKPARKTRQTKRGKAIALAGSLTTEAGGVE